MKKGLSYSETKHMNELDLTLFFECINAIEDYAKPRKTKRVKNINVIPEDEEMYEADYNLM